LNILRLSSNKTVSFSCEQDEPEDREYPLVKTENVNNITPDGARFNATVVSVDVETITEYEFERGTSSFLDLQHSEQINNPTGLCPPVC
jgi:hypothetical protein